MRTWLFRSVVYVAVFALGLTGGLYLALYLQNQIALLAGLAVLFAFLTWFGSGAEVLELLRNWYKESKVADEEQKKIPRIEYEPQIFDAENHRFSGIAKRVGKNGKVVQLRIVNRGLNPADRCTGRVDFVERIKTRYVRGETRDIVMKDLTLSWNHFEVMPQVESEICTSSYVSIGEEIQELYATKFNQDLDFNCNEWLEVCLTIKDHDVAYILACDRKSTLSLGKEYKVEIQLVGRNLHEELRTYLLDLRSWDEIRFEEQKE
jgi:hypothetical protein